MRNFTAQWNGYVLGLDLGDRKSRYLLLDAGGREVEEGSVLTTRKWLEMLFDYVPQCRVVMEVGTHSPWVSRMAQGRGHEVVVANPRRVRLIYDNDQKGDGVDARSLARLGRVDANLLYPIQHRGRQSQADLGLLRSREALIKARVGLINHARGVVKAWGARLPKCSTKSFPNQVKQALPQELEAAVGPIVELVGKLNEQIAEYEKKIEERARAYPEIELLRSVDGVGLLVSSCYVWTLEDPGRFGTSREVGPYLGLIPRRDQSGEVDRRGGITKAGDEGLRRLLVQSAQYILGPFGKDCDLRRFGLKLADSGGRKAKKRAIIAVTRKLAVLLHRLWVSGEAYDPFHQGKRRAA